MDTRNPNRLLERFPPVRWTEEALFEEERRLREEVAGRDGPILYPTADPNMIAINIGDPLVKCDQYSLLHRVKHVTEEDMAKLRSLNQAYRIYNENNSNKNPPIENPWSEHLNVKLKVNPPYRGRTAPPRPQKSPEERARIREAERQALRAKEEKSVKYYLMSPEEATARLAEARAKAAAAPAYSVIARKKLMSSEELEAATGTEVQVEGGVSVLKRPFEDLNPAAAAESSTANVA